MATGRDHLNVTSKYKGNIYSITLDMAGWDKTTVQVIGPVAAPLSIYGTNNPGDLTGVRQGDAKLATDFMPIQATKLSDGTAVSAISAAGLFQIPVNAQFLRLQGGGADVYQMRFFHSKTV